MMRVEIIVEYDDLLLRRRIPKGERIQVEADRAAQLIAAKVAISADDAKQSRGKSLYEGGIYEPERTD